MESEIERRESNRFECQTESQRFSRNDGENES